MNKIMTYLIGTLNQSERAAKRNESKLSKYEDIKNEFETWIDTQEYPDNGVLINGYNAKKISKMADFMNGLGVYNFLVTLRDNPEFAFNTINDGFRRK